MKKTVFCVIIVLLLLLASCTNTPVPLSYTVDTTSIYTESHDECLLSFCYPSFSQNDNLTDTVRDYSKAYMDNYITYNHPGNGYYYYEINSVFAAYLSETFASFLCTGSYYSEDSAHPIPIVYTINIDLVNMHLLESRDIIGDFDVIAKLFKSNMSFISTGNPRIDAEISKLSREELICAYSELYGIYPPVYFIGDQNNVSLALSVETVHTLGGHAEFSININRAKDALSDEIYKLISNNSIN